MKIKNDVFSLNMSDSGYLQSIRLINDPYRMNWVLSERYLKRTGYKAEKLFGEFDFFIDDTHYFSRDVKPIIYVDKEKITSQYTYDKIVVTQIFDLNNNSGIVWEVIIENKSGSHIKFGDFGLWSSFAYVMFRDKNVQKNIFNSAAVFPSISQDYSKMAVMRRSTKAPSVGLFQIEGETLSIGTHCQFENKFFENVSPSLDGILAHRIIISEEKAIKDNDYDWIYSTKTLKLEPKEKKRYQFKIEPINSQADFYHKAETLGHPRIEYADLIYTNQPSEFKINSLKKVKQAIDYVKVGNEVQATILEKTVEGKTNETILKGVVESAGEHVMRVWFEDDTMDQVIYNVSDAIKDVIENRVSYVCNQLYSDKKPYIFNSESNQGESLGKLSLVLKKNLLTEPNESEILKVEKSVNHYVLNKWFEEGDFSKPQNLYGDFYRVMDFEYIGHLFYLLSKIPANYLSLQTQETYLQWAAEVVELRINPLMHQDIRAKEEAEMLGVFFLYMNDLITDLLEYLPEKGEKISKLWQSNLLNIAEDSSSYRSAMTEHFYDNAGFGPATGALAQAGFVNASERYADLVLANIGFSNDFRAQNPDRWWEALTYMIHSLWGGVTAAAAYDAALHLNSIELMEASYRATVAILYCYDHNASATTPLNIGEAASTFAVSSPLMNRLDLSRKRFGQEVFVQDGGIFSKLFANAPDSSDWDMGEELVAYLDRFGQNAFCYYDEKNKKLKGINCLIQEKDQEYHITNMAPYPKDIFFFGKNGWEIISKELKKSAISF